MTMTRFRRTDPWWDMDGAGVRRDRTRRRIVGGLAFSVSIVACGLTVAAWIQQFQPVIHHLGI